MALEYKDRVSDTSSTTGTGTLALLSAAATGFRTFAAAGYTTGATVRYSITSADLTEWEVGQGVWTSSGATLTRVTVYASSNANALVSFSAGTKTVTNVNTAADLVKACVFATLTTAANSTTAGWQKVPINNVVQDATGIWNAANTRIIPTVPGYYWVSVNFRMNSTGASLAGIGKNGAIAYMLGTDVQASVNVGGSILIQCNGSTDYIEAFMYTTTSRAFDTTGVNNISFSGPI